MPLWTCEPKEAMPGLVRRILIFAAVDGLVLQPAPPRNHRPATEQAISISYGKNAIAPLLKDRRDEPTSGVSFESYGIIGLLKISSASYLISISDREQVASIRGRPIYVVHDVALIPLSSQSEAQTALKQARDARQRRVRDGRGYDPEELYDSGDEATLTDNESLPDNEQPKASSDKHKRGSSVVEDVINKKGVYGRFTDRWFSRKGWDAEGRRRQGMGSEEQVNQAGVDTGSDTRDAAVSDTQKGDAQASASREKNGDDAASAQAESKAVNAQNQAIALLPRILRTAKIFFGSKSFFFSYDYDLSRSLPLQHRDGQGLNLHNSFDSLFFWNKHLLRPFADAGQQAFTMPLLQGFVGQRAFTLAASASRRASVVDSSSIPEEVMGKQGNAIEEEADLKPPPEAKTGERDFLLTIISRRSVKRAGLRYLRRGVDADGNVANCVETEQILSTPSWGTSGDRIYSFLQLRGSIPVFFSQSPYSFKPLPVFHGSQDTNAAAFKKHFQSLATRYGDVQSASLVDKHGSEMSVGESYQDHAKKLNEAGGIDGKGKALGFEWFDFHAVCKGMKFENVSQLMNTLALFLKSSGWTLEEGGALSKTQTGILRTNCMDCLDRTNVVQSATARDVLEYQLGEQGLEINLHTDPSTAWFNSLWADNGDAISKQYAGTAALKGDFTRTRHRNVSGALTDFGLTLSRYYNNIVNDYLAQVFIDFALGNATESIFSDFEADMKAQDYAVDLRKVRQNAIQTCTKIVIEDAHEDLVAGWTLSCPAKTNTLRSLPFEECALLLSQSAVYFCRFDWGTEKVREFERIDLANLRGIYRGVYITSTLAQRDMDEGKNVGIVLRYTTAGPSAKRLNTRSLASEEERSGDDHQRADEQDTPQSPAAEETDPSEHFLAFKALPPKSSFVTGDGQDAHQLGEQEMVKSVSEEIARVANEARRSGQVPTSKELKIEGKEIISVAEARKSTGMLEQIGYNLKKLVWA